jgi:hypothetical protein
MSSYGEPSVQHTSTVQQILDARERALNAVSLARKVTLSTPHPNLAATDGGRDAEIASNCSQALVDYLLHLRPYRAQSRNWNIDLGALALPKSVQDDGPSRRGDGGQSGQPLYLCRRPQVRLAGLSDVIDAVNSTVMYSSNRQGDASMSRQTKDRVKTESGELVVEDRRLFRQILRGETTIDDVIDHPAVHPPKTTRADYTPAQPPLPGGDSKTFKLVLSDDQLLQLFEAADEIAGEVDMLAEIEPPDHSSDGGDSI